MIKSRDPKTGRASGGSKIRKRCLVCRKTVVDYEYQKRKFCSVSCSAKHQPRPIIIPACHPDRKHAGRGFCRPCLAFRAGLMRNYDLTAEQWEKLFLLQDGLCPICKKYLRRPGNIEGMRAANVDHCHKTGRVRGLVCHICNRNRIGTNTLETSKMLLQYLSQNIDGRNL